MKPIILSLVLLLPLLSDAQTGEQKKLKKIDFFIGVGPEYHQRTVEKLEYDPKSGNIDVIDFYEWFGPNYTEKREPDIRFSLGMNINLRPNSD